MTTKRKTKAKVKKAKAFLIKPRTFTINPDGKDGTFDAQGFAWAIAHAFGHSNPVFEYTRPLTVAELEQAEALAHAQMEQRVEGGPSEGVPLSVADELVEDPDCGRVGAMELASWAMDVQAEAYAWEKIANELLAAREAAEPIKKAA